MIKQKWDEVFEDKRALMSMTASYTLRTRVTFFSLSSSRTTAKKAKSDHLTCHFWVSVTIHDDNVDAKITKCDLQHTCSTAAAMLNSNTTCIGIQRFRRVKATNQLCHDGITYGSSIMQICSESRHRQCLFSPGK